jgi:shikimate dehydrogenase
MIIYGLIGKKLDYSFSRDFFKEKFRLEGIDADYQNFEVDRPEAAIEILKTTPNLAGLNVTIPYKESIIPFLDEVDEIATEIGAVNTIQIVSQGTVLMTKGFNTDWLGFLDSISAEKWAGLSHAVILGSGGASKAIQFALRSKGVHFDVISRKSEGKKVGYSEASDLISKCDLLVNCTPLGTWPDVTSCPEIPYIKVSLGLLAYDLVYNPVETEFLKRCKTAGAEIQNGLPMLKAQALRAWQIWNG